MQYVEENGETELHNGVWTGSNVLTRILHKFKGVALVLVWTDNTFEKWFNGQKNVHHT